MMLYGGHNNQAQIIYDSAMFTYIDRLIKYQENFKKYSSTIIFNNNNYVKVENYITTLADTMIPNLESIYIIKLDPHKLFNTKQLDSNETNIMIVFNHNNYKNIELLVNTENKIGFFYEFVNPLTVCDILNLYNNSSDYKIITVFIIKRPFWIR
jgi:hypothetical protein